MEQASVFSLLLFPFFPPYLLISEIILLELVSSVFKYEDLHSFLTYISCTSQTCSSTYEKE